MRSIFSKTGLSQIAIAGTFLISAGLASAADVKVNLSGAEETPPTTTSASGSGTITVNADKSVSGTITTKGVAGTAAHIHLAVSGKSGPPVITLTKVSDDKWSVPAGSTLTDEQYASFQEGKLYINVHSAENKKGEIRGQLTP